MPFIPVPPAVGIAHIKSKETRGGLSYTVVDTDDAMEVEEVRPSCVQDIDLVDENDPFACSCYVNDIHSNLRRVEVIFNPNVVV